MYYYVCYSPALGWYYFTQRRNRNLRAMLRFSHRYLNSDAVVRELTKEEYFERIW